MEVYRKKSNGRYESIGHEWSGFPADGIWFVKDGTQNCMIYLNDIGKKPKHLLELAQYQDDCTAYISDKMRDEGQYSVADLAKWAAEFYAQKLDVIEEEKNVRRY
jgi:hypothetical protein